MDGGPTGLGDQVALFGQSLEPLVRERCAPRFCDREPHLGADGDGDSLSSVLYRHM